MANKTTKPKFKRIVLHHTAGVYKPNDIDLSHYHYLINHNGQIFEGKYKPEDNLDCKDGKYAPHCGGGNTGAIGIALCGNIGWTTSQRHSACPLTHQQFEAMWKLCAELCIKYNLKPENVVTHAKFGKDNPNTTSYGKIDIIHIPYNNLYGVEEVNKLCQDKINWYYLKLKNKEI